MQQQTAIMQHYVHMEQHPHSQRTQIKSFHCYEDNTHHHCIAIVNHNTIEIYRHVGSSVIYHRTCHFMCDITILEIVPLKGNATDIFFIADQLGRYMFWHLQRGSLLASNTIKAPQYLAPAYLKVPTEEKQPQFSGINCTFNSFDTHTVIFFTVSTKIILLKLKISKGNITLTCPPQQIQMPYIDINFMGMIKGKDPQIGIIEQKEQKTFLRIHKPQQFECTFSLQKTNLTRFYSSEDTDELILITNSQLNIYLVKNQQIFCTFQIPEPGYVSSLKTGLYIFVGEVGSQMLVFSRKMYKNYGAIGLENQVCMRLAGHGVLDDGGYLVSVIDQGHTVEFLAIYEDNWKSVKSIFSTCSLFSVEDTEQSNQCLAVAQVGQNLHQVGILSKHLPSTLHHQSPTLPILHLHTTTSTILLHQLQQTSLLKYNPSSQSFIPILQLEQSSTIINAFSKYIVTDHMIIEFDENNQSMKNVMIQKGTIVDAQFYGQFIGYMMEDFTYKFWNVGTMEVDRVRKNCMEEYLWRFVAEELLAVGMLDMPGQIKLVPVFKEATTVNLKCNQLIVDMILMNNVVFICFSNCLIQVYDFPNFNLIQQFTCAAQPLQFLPCSQNLLAYSTSECYIIRFLNSNSSNLKQQQPKQLQLELKRIQFDPSKQITSVGYLEKANKFVVAHQRSLALYSIVFDRPQYASNFRVISVSVSQLPPFVTTKAGIVYIVQSYEVLAKSLATGQLLKKQSHGLKEISCIEKLDVGLIVFGVNDMDLVEFFVFSYSDLQILCNQYPPNPEPSKSPPTSIKYLHSNTFYLRSSNTVSLLQLSASSLTLKQKWSSKTNLNGYTLSIQPQLQSLVISDPLMYLVVYDYRLDKLVSLCRYQSINTINDVGFVGKAVAVGDAAGMINIVEFQFEGGEVGRTGMVEVGGLRVGGQVINIVKANDGVLYSTISGLVGRIKPICTQHFSILKKAQKQVFQKQSKNVNQLRYQEWVNRNSGNDKLIDGFLIQYYLSTNTDDSNEKQKEKEEVRKVWELISQKKGHKTSGKDGERRIGEGMDEQ